MAKTSSTMTTDQLTFLMEVFPNKTQEQIVAIVRIVEEDQSLNNETRMDAVCNILASAQNDVGEVNVRENAAADDSQDSSDEEGAVGYADNNLGLNDFVTQLQNLFPDACEAFLTDFCMKRSVRFNLNEAIVDLATEGYVKKTRDVNAIWNRLKDTLPFADPTYLREQAEKLATEDPNNLEDFVAAAIENNDYPTMEEYLKQKEQDAKLDLYRQDVPVDNFLEKFMEVFPDPETHFADPNRPNPLLEPELPEEDLLYAKIFLYNKYPYIRKRHVDLVFKMQKKSLMGCCDALDNIMKGLKTKRSEERLPACRNLALLQEVAYLKHRRLIRKLIKYKQQVYMQFKEEARALGLLETCGVCTEDELIPEECFNCMKGCIFCKDCVTKYVEVRMGEGLATFPCCNDCDSEFNLRILQLVLPQHTFEKLVLKIQSEEIKRANVDGLETCPFCDFASIPPEDSKIFKCENKDCLKESCRLCRHESHVPMRCNEIEYDEDVRRRTYIEDMMTEALARTCYKCNKKFIKTNGCNKMRCNCGGMMCYLCSQPINGYDHFGGAKPCQLFTNDTQINLSRVQQSAENAKRNLGDVEIKFDPSVGIEEFFVN